MQKIGRGFQYIVFDLKNGRVRKKKYSKIIQYLYILIKNYSYRIKTNRQFSLSVVADSWKVLSQTLRMEEAANAYIKEILPFFDNKLLGSPVFLADGYEQDHASTLGDVLKSCSVETGKKIFDSYIALIHTTWCYGFADAVFNFATNNSLNAESEVVQIDFGELVFNKSDVQFQIENKRWLTSASYTLLKPGPLKDYFYQLSISELTIENLEKLWRSKIVQTEG